MKKIKRLAVLFFLITACKKEASDNARQNTPTIVGQWEYIFTNFSYITPENLGLT